MMSCAPPHCTIGLWGPSRPSVTSCTCGADWLGSQAHLQKIIQAFRDYRQHGLRHVAHVESGFRTVRPQLALSRSIWASLPHNHERP